MEKGILTLRQVQVVYNYSVENGIKFASAAIRLGYSTEKEALICLTEQIGFPGIELLNSKFEINKNLIPFEIAMSKKILPLKVSEKNLIIAISDPYDKVLIDEISFLTGKKVIAYLAIEDILLKVIQEVYSSDKTYYEPPNYDSEEFFLSVISPSVMSFIEQDEESEELIVGELLEEDEESEIPENGGNEKKVLIVDDEDDILKLVSKIVKKLNMQPITIDNGNDAINIIRKTKPDLIILDAMLPGKHGFEICKEIKESEVLSSIPVLIISAIYKGWQFEHDIVNIYKADKFLEKPFRISVLMDTIKELISSGNGNTQINSDENKQEKILSLSAKLINEGNFKEAKKILEKAVKVAPFYYKFRYLLGYTYLMLDNNYMAISEFEATIDINRKFFPAIKELAVLYEKMGFRNKAIEKWQTAIEATEDNKIKEKIKKHLIDLVSSI